MIFKSSLRLKLLCLLALSVGLAILPFALYSARGLERTYRESAWQDIRDISETVAADLEAQYQIYLTNAVLNVILKKDSMRRLGGLVKHNRGDLEALPSPQREIIIANQTRFLTSYGILVDWVPVETGPDQHSLGPLATPADWENIRGLAGRSIKTLVANPGSLSPSGEFVVFKSAWPKDGPPRFFLLHLVPDAARRGTLLLLTTLDEFNGGPLGDTTPGQPLEIVAAGLQGDLHSGFGLKGGTSVNFMDSAGNSLASLGGAPPDYPWTELMPEASRLGQMETVLTPRGGGEPVIARMTYFQPLESFLLLTLPESFISEPARAIVRHIVWLGFLVMLLVLAAGFYFSVRLTGPLNLLTTKTLALTKADFSSPETVAGLLGGLPLERGDEVGRLARAFARMGHGLGRNIEERMAATTVKERLEGELGVARNIQMGMLPSPDSLPPDMACRIGGFLVPAKEVGGDFYDFFPAPDGRLAVVIGDVSDKGAPAALFMAMTVTLVRQTIENGLSPAGALAQINDCLVVKNPEGLFVTLFLGLVDLATGGMEFANGGHCQPLLAGGPKGPRCLEDLSGLVLGAWPGQKYTGYTTTLDPSEICVLYTDGVTEAQDEQRALFGMPRLAETVAAGSKADPEEMNRRIYQATENFRGAARPSDDLTLLSFRFRGPL